LLARHGSHPGKGWFKPSQSPAEPKGLLRQAIVSLKEAIEARDRYTMGHSTRVRRYSLAMAVEMGLDPSIIRELELGAELHDVGKIGVPDELLHKPGGLTPAEHRRVLEHTVIGERILAPLFDGRPVILAIVRSHHEWVDGSGFPDGLHGEAIPLVVRILAVADAFDAMTSARPYRPALSLATAVRELVRCTNTQFDARCVSALLTLLTRMPGFPVPVRRPVAEVASTPAIGRNGAGWLERLPARTTGHERPPPRAGVGEGFA
jgi:HD-GYP domain-containing protein (c-di-GMP phosphodiesterase class II)